MIFALAGFLLLLSIALLVVGLRGYAIDRHPLCRKCGFDLTGKPETSTRCPECGADLSLAKAIRIGHRRRRRGALAAGIGLLVLTLAFAGVATWSAVEDFDWEQVKPTWLVIHEASDRSGGVPMIAWKELSRRLMAGELSKEQSGKIADLAVSIQGDRARTWNGVYGDFVESAHAAGTLSDTQWNQYARQAPALSLALRGQIRRGDDIPVAVVDNGNRVGSKSGLYMRIHSLHGVGDLIDPANQGNGSSTEMLQNTGAGSSGTSLQVLHKAATTAPLGERKIDVWCNIEIRDGFSDKGPVLAEWKQTFSGTWTLVDADAPTVEMINDPSYRANVEGSVKVGQLDASSSSSMVTISLNFQDLKVPLSYDVILRIDGKEQKFCTMAIGAGNCGESAGGQAKLNGAKNVDVILRPNADAARNTPTMTQMWNGEVTLKNVPVTYRP